METKKVLTVLFFIMFLVFIGFGIIIPVLPFYAEDLGASPTELGLLMAVYSFMQLIFAPIWGQLSDRIGRKPILLIGISGLAVSFFLMAIADSLWMLFVARIFGGHPFSCQYADSDGICSRYYNRRSRIRIFMSFFFWE